jgi:uncharacterized membrane protein YbhN (UPF0104 family)
VKTFKTHLQNVLLTGLLVFTVVFCWLNRQAIQQAFELSVADLVIVVLAYLAYSLLMAEMACYLLRRRNIPGASLPQMLVVNSYSSLLGYVTFFRVGYYSGKALFYLQAYQVPLSVSIGLMGLVSVLVICATAVLGVLLGLVAVLLTDAAIPPLYWVLLVSALGFCAGVVGVVFGLVRLPLLPPRLQNWASKVRAVFLQSSPTEVGVISAYTALTVLCQSLAYAVLFAGFGLQLPPLSIAFMAIFAGLSLIVSLTPANLGVKEFVLWLVLSHLGIAASELVAVLVVDRILLVLLTIATSASGYRTLAAATTTKPQ